MAMENIDNSVDQVDYKIDQNSKKVENVDSELLATELVDVDLPKDKQNLFDRFKKKSPDVSNINDIFDKFTSVEGDDDVLDIFKNALSDGTNEADISLFNTTLKSLPEEQQREIVQGIIRNLSVLKLKGSKLAEKRKTQVGGEDFEKGFLEARAIKGINFSIRPIEYKVGVDNKPIVTSENQDFFDGRAHNDSLKSTASGELLTATADRADREFFYPLNKESKTTTIYSESNVSNNIREKFQENNIPNNAKIVINVDKSVFDNPNFKSNSNSLQSIVASDNNIDINNIVVKKSETLIPNGINIKVTIPGQPEVWGDPKVIDLKTSFNTAETTLTQAVKNSFLSTMSKYINNGSFDLSKYKLLGVDKIVGSASNTSLGDNNLYAKNRLSNAVDFLKSVGIPDSVIDASVKSSTVGTSSPDEQYAEISLKVQELIKPPKPEETKEININVPSETKVTGKYLYVDLSEKSKK